MLLLIMRHGIAEELEEGNAPDDAARRLTAKGEARVHAIAEYIKPFVPPLTHTAASPRIRAQQTVQIAGKVLGGGAITTLDSLDFDGSWGWLVKQLQDITSDDPEAVVLVAGHMPLCSELVMEALLQRREGFDMKKGAVACLSWDGPISETGAELKFYVTYGIVKKVNPADE